jgi:hypothetical protein
LSGLKTAMRVCASGSLVAVTLLTVLKFESLPAL